MSQIERQLTAFLARRPEIEKCLQLGLVNRRALARLFLAQHSLDLSRFDAAVAALRRHDASAVPERAARDLFPEVRIGLKDRILILDLEKEKALLQRLERLLAQINYDRGDTLKVVLGTASLKVILDERKEAAFRSSFERFKTRHRWAGISEISMMFPDEAMETRGILSVIAREFAVNDITISEFLTASPELLIYLKDEYVPKAHDVLRGLQRTG